MSFSPFLLLIICMTSLATPAIAQPEIEFKSRSYDFGTVAPRQNLVHDFVFQNKGDTPLVVVDIKITCGCTATVLSATTTPVGATGVISVTMTTNATTSKMRKSTIVQTNDPEHREVTLHTIANVVDIWKFNPKAYFNLGDVPFDSEKSETLYLTNTHDDPFEIVGYKLNDSKLSCSIGDPTPDGVPITVTLKAGETKENIRDSLIIETDHKTHTYCQTNVTAKVVGYVRFDRPRVYFGAVNKGKTVSREIVASTNLDPKEPLNISEIHTRDDVDITGSVEGRLSNGGLRLKITIKVPEKPGYHAGDIVMKTNLEEEPTTTIPYSVVVRAVSSLR